MPAKVIPIRKGVRNPLPMQILMGQHDFRFGRHVDVLATGKELNEITMADTEVGMFCILCHAPMNSERGQQPCAGKED